VVISSISSLPYGPSPRKHWDVVPLKHLATMTNGLGFRSEDWADQGTPIIRIENLNGSHRYNYSNLSVSDKYRVTAGDLLFAWSGNPGTSFGPFRWNTPGQYFLNQHIYKLSVHGCDKDWLFWTLKAATQWIERELASDMMGMVHVTKEDLGKVQIPVPPIEEQRRLARFLNTELIKVDNSPLTWSGGLPCIRR
jgi:type I restriction enzyme S subunit